MMNSLFHIILRHCNNKASHNLEENALMLSWFELSPFGFLSPMKCSLSKFDIHRAYVNFIKHRKVKKINKTQIHHVILYSECNPQFPFSVFSPSFTFQLFKQMLNELSMFNDYFQFLMGFFKKQININVTVVSGSYVLLYYKQSLYVIYQ
jgi:hypothetical protein